MNKETGEPALPDTEWLSIRDYFAAKAMQGLLAADTNWSMNADMIAHLAGEQADAMIKERSK